jgi:hypothetical protein
MFYRLSAYEKKRAIAYRVPIGDYNHLQCIHKLNCETERKYDFRTLILSFYSLVFLRHFLRMLRLVVFSSKTKSYQEQKTREIAMAKPAEVILNKSCVELFLLSKCTFWQS